MPRHDKLWPGSELGVAPRRDPSAGSRSPVAARCRGAAPRARRALASLAGANAFMIERRFHREFRSLESIVSFVNEYLAELGFGGDEPYDIHLIIEELFTNMVKYSRESTQDIAIGLDWKAPMLTVRLRDFDVNPFDVTQ